ncbi:MAG: nuclear transport factor 2 family protein [Novosphingobium sp.]|uniref:YybH family protein n=1 Tax=Novosphingobium sp. TaxID=1874826 RepID=UPI003C7DDCB1
MPKSKLLSFLSAAAALALVAGCAKAPTNDSAKVGDEVKTNMTEMVAAFAARDADKAVSWDAPDFVGMLHGTPNVTGQEADRALTKEQVADPAMKLSVSDAVVDVAASGDLAVWRATYNYTYTDPATKKAKTEVGNWVVGWKRGADGQMKEAWGVVSDTPPPAAAAPPA